MEKLLLNYEKNCSDTYFSLIETVINLKKAQAAFSVNVYIINRFLEEEIFLIWDDKKLKSFPLDIKLY